MTLVMLWLEVRMRCSASQKTTEYVLIWGPLAESYPLSIVKRSNVVQWGDRSLYLLSRATGVRVKWKRDGCCVLLAAVITK